MVQQTIAGSKNKVLGDGSEEVLEVVQDVVVLDLLPPESRQQGDVAFGHKDGQFLKFSATSSN